MATKLDVIKASEWGMAPIAMDDVAHRDVAAILEANVHHSDSEPLAHHEMCPAAIRGFDQYHRTHNGWAAIGYSRCICSHGTVYLCRPLRVVPAAAKDHNTPIIAYCLIAKQGKATAAQWTALKAMIKRDAASVDRALKLTTHREVWPYTDCPGDSIEAQVEALRKAGGKIEPPAPPQRQPLSDNRRENIDALTEGLGRLAAHLKDGRPGLTHPDEDRLRELRTVATRVLKVGTPAGR